MQSIPARTPRSRWRWLVWVSVSLAILIGVGVVVMAVVSSRARRDVEERMADLRARGEPTSPSEIAFEDRTAAPDWDENREAFCTLWDSAWQLPDDFGESTDDLAGIDEWEFADRARAEVAAYSACLRASGQLGSDRDHAVVSRLFSRMMDPREVDRRTDCARAGLKAWRALNEPLVPAASRVLSGTWDGGRREVRALKGLDGGVPCFRSYYALLECCKALANTIPALLEDGNVNEAMSRIRLMARGIDELRDPPMMVSAQAWQVSVGVLLRSCQHVLASHATNVDWSSVQKSLTGWKPTAAFERGLMGDRVLCLTVTHGFRDDTLGADRPAYGEWWQRPLAEWWIARDERFLLDWYAQVLSRTRGKNSVAECPPDSLRGDVEGIPSTALVSRLLLPNFVGSWRGTLELETKLRLLRVAIEAARSGSAEGQRAASREIDPLSGQPLRSRVDGDVLTLWSLGWNAVDDGADLRNVTFTQAGRDQKYPADIVVHVRIH